MLDQAQISLGESQGTCPSRVEIFKGLLRNGVNKGNIDGEEEKGESQEASCRRVGIFRWLFKNGMNKMNIDVIETKVLIHHY